MKKQYLVLISSLLFFVFASVATYAQMVGTNCYLQGRYLEIGMNRNGSFGACNANGAIPVGFHPHLSGSGIPPAGSNLAETYDYGKDGWATGAPPYMGDYTYPGSPFEGWEIQVGAGRSQAFQNCAGTTSASVGGVTIAGSHTAYTNVGGRAIGTWTGTASTLAIRQETRVDTQASWVVVTTVMRNTGAAATGNVYYLRSCDPDNDQSWPGGGFFTNNTIVHQNQDATHRVLVTATGAGYPTQAFMGLGTKDCRARCFIYNSWSISSGIDLSEPWNGTMANATYNLGGTRNGDIGIGLVYNIGAIPAGDSAIVSYAYIFSNASGIDSAFPDPQIVINGVPRVSYAPPTPNYDTFDACAYPGLTILPVDIRFADDKSWSWSDWTWSPGTGLATTTGVTNFINISMLPSIITYTITGTDSATGMYSCNRKVFYLTIITCNGAEANSPCVGDTLWLNAPGDSTAATYQWYGPAPYTSTPIATTQKTFFFPATAAMSGAYRVIKTVSGISDTFYTTVDIRHRPTVIAGSNAPLCQGVGNTLLLTAVSDSPSVAYSWTAVPPPFTSSLQNPTIPGFSNADTGMYRVIVTSVYGCKDTDMVHVTMVDPPEPPTIIAVTPYCQGDAFVPFVVTDLEPGGAALWYTSAVGGVGSATAPVINTAVAGTYTFYYSQIIGSCESDRDTLTIVVNPVPAPITGITGVCQYFTTTLSTTSVGGTWTSSNPAIATINTVSGLVTGVNPGTVVISYTLPTTCRATTVVTVHPKPAPPGVPEVRYCQYDNASTLVATGVGPTFTWYGLGVTPPMPNVVPSTNTPGIFNYFVTQTTVYGCVSDSAVFPVRILPEPTAPITRDTGYCQYFPGVVPALTAQGDSLRWYISSTSTAGTFTPPVPSVEIPGQTTWWVSQVINTCESPKTPITVTILYLPEFKITADKDWVCQFDSLNMRYDGPELVQPAYEWTLPFGSSFANGTASDDRNVMVSFDTVWGLHDVVLKASNYNGQCFTYDTMRIRVIPVPNAHAYMKTDLCIGDTITLALSSRSANSHKFTWLVDGSPLGSNPALSIISANVNSGGPYVVRWNDTGLHIINVTGITAEGCIALPTADTVKVHSLPDPRFVVQNIPTNKLCVEDSLFFTALVRDYSYNYKWEPEHSFANENKPEIWGKVETSRSKITLTVTNPFGCKASYYKQINPDECCTVSFPNAFTPNQDGKNDVFRPIFAGYRRFHVFRVINRWGQTVFESANSNPSWDGTYGGVNQDMGTYYYFLRYDCGGKTLETKGDITLIR